MAKHNHLIAAAQNGTIQIVFVVEHIIGKLQSAFICFAENIETIYVRTGSRDSNRNMNGATLKQSQTINIIAKRPLV